LAIRALNHQYEQVIDSIVITSVDEHERQQYVSVNAAGVGFDAYISRMMQAAKTRGITGYTNMMLRAYNTYQSGTYTLTLGDRTITRNAWIIALQNSSRIGYGVPVAPQARLDDGIIDISIVDKIPIDHLPITAPLALTNHLQLSQHVEMFRTSEVLIEGNDDKWVDIDGEGINLGRAVRFVNQPRSVHVYARDTRQPLIIRNPSELLSFPKP
jgi:diacylglycerol kinase family enzyme